MNDWLLKPVRVFSLLFILACFFVPHLVYQMKGLKFIYNVTHSLKGSVFLMKTFKKEDLKDLSKGDIIVLVHKKFPEKYLIKKVSHISGECFDARGYVDLNHQANMKKIVPDNHVAVTGDHDRSFDSRYEDFGFVSKDNIVGKAWYIF